MALIPGSEVKMNDSEIAQNAPISESLHLKYGANINSLIDKTDASNVAIAANTALIGALTDLQVESASGTVPTSNGTVATFSTTVLAAVISISRNGTDNDDAGCGVVLQGSTTSVPVEDGASNPRNVQFSLSGSTIQVTHPAGWVGTGQAFWAIALV